ncbi:MAG: hypothetical protein WA400_09645 [Silvibacterium sp.]
MVELTIVLRKVMERSEKAEWIYACLKSGRAKIAGDRIDGLIEGVDLSANTFNQISS